MSGIVEGEVRYPDELPCPQVDTTLTPRERRYISDVSEVKKMRTFQRGFQAKREHVSFVFSETQAEVFQRWYQESIIEGGAWFYADWPLLHTEKDVCHRFVTRPVWKFLARGFFHVTATIEVYERKVGRTANVYTSKIYPHYFSDNVTNSNVFIRGMPFAKPIDHVTASNISIVNVTYTKWIYSNYAFSDDIQTSHISFTATQKKYIYSAYAISDDITGSNISISGRITNRLIDYDYFTDDVKASNISIVAGEKK